jgi:DNA-directed RNA polymerase subunit E"
MTKKVCAMCKRFHEEQKCPSCGSTESKESWKGRIIVINPEKSEVAQSLKIKTKGEYAIKKG